MTSDDYKRLDEAGLEAAVRECARITAPEISDEEFARIKADNSPRYQNTRAEMARTITAYLSAASVKVGEPSMTDEQIKYMAERFLMWKLPEHFNPDCGISFNQSYRSDHGPVGTNLFDYPQATAMVRHMVEGMPAPTASVGAMQPWPKALNVTRAGYNSWHGDISFAERPTDDELAALHDFLRENHKHSFALAAANQSDGGVEGHARDIAGSGRAPVRGDNGAPESPHPTTAGIKPGPSDTPPAPQAGTIMQPVLVPDGDSASGQRVEYRAVPQAVAAVSGLKTPPELLALIERAKNHVMTPEEVHEQRRSFAKGMCPSHRDYKEWCEQIDRLMPPLAKYKMGVR